MNKFLTKTVSLRSFKKAAFVLAYIGIIILFCILIFLLVLIIKAKPKTSLIQQISKVRLFNNKNTDYKTTIITNSWTSSLFYDPFSKPLFAIPLSYNYTSDGVEIGKPLTSFSEKTIFYSHTVDFVLSLTDTRILSKKVDSTGEWDTKVSLKGENNTLLKTHITKGSPIFYFSSSESSLTLRALRLKDFKVLEKNVYLLSFEKKAYILSGKGINFSSNNSSFTINPGNRILLIALPDEYSTTFDKSKLKPLYTCIYEPDTTSLDITSSKGKFNVILGNTNFIKKESLLTTWPHMKSSIYQITNNSRILGTYNTSKGTLSLICDTSLRAAVSSSPLPLNMGDMIQKEKLNDPYAKELFQRDLKRFNEIRDPRGVYFKGKYLKDLVDLWELAALIKNDTDKKELLSRLKNQLAKEIHNFKQDPATLLVFHSNPEFGHEKGNDHHFQYSYYIYFFSKLYPYLNNTEKGAVDEIMRNLITEGIPGAEADNSLYPKTFRFLDVYEGHSWADGQSLFNDGNNQESTSEALFYWYSMWLWGQTVSADKLSALSLFAFYSELSSRNSYWFFDSNRYLESNFSKPIVSIIWGGKSDYTTWFSPDDDKILGIQFLPINPSSIVSFKLSSPTLKRLTAYYDTYFKENPNSKSFYNYYLFFKKINGLNVPSEIRDVSSDYFSHTLYYLIK